MDSADDLVVCAYNKAHVVRRSRMAIHYRKCEQNFDDHLQLQRCPFNSIHVMKKEEVEAHQRICPDRGNFDQFLTCRNHTKEPQMASPVVTSTTDEENWDDVSCLVDRPVLAVVKEKAKEKDIYRNVSNVPPAQRKAHRAQEEKRRHELQKKNQK